jgi:hypothetical protein
VMPSHIVAPNDLISGAALGSPIFVASLETQRGRPLRPPPGEMHEPAPLYSIG